MDPCLKKMLVHTINIRRVVSKSLSGTEVLGDPIEIKAYIEEKQDRIISPFSGKEVVTTHFIVTEDEIQREDRIYLPGFDPLTERFSQKPVVVERFYEPLTGAVDHYEVVL